MLVYQRVRSHRPCDGKSPMFAGEERKPSCPPTKNWKKNRGQVSSSTRFFFTVHDFWKRKSHLEKGGFQVMGILNRWMVYVSENPSNWGTEVVRKTMSQGGPPL